jgi:hypothetical protein
LPVPIALIRKTPLPLFLICALLMGPFSPLGSLYLNPFAALPLQKGSPVVGLMPCGNGNVWLPGVPPFALTVSVAPPTVGSPTIVLPLPFSLALPTTFRLSGVLGFLSCSVSPRMVWSAAHADDVTTSNVNASSDETRRTTASLDARRIEALCPHRESGRQAFLQLQAPNRRCCRRKRRR